MTNSKLLEGLARNGNGINDTAMSMSRSFLIAIAASFLAMETMVQTEQRISWNPWWLVIFFSTFLMYNAYRFIVLAADQEGQPSGQPTQHSKLFYGVMVSFAFGLALCLTGLRWQTIAWLIPLGMFCLAYHFPVYFSKQVKYSLRDIPYLKIFLITVVWTIATVTITIIQSGAQVSLMHHALVWIERFVFISVFALHADIADIRADTCAGLKTIPVVMGQNNSVRLGNFLLLVFAVLTILHYGGSRPALLLAFLLSAFCTFVLVNHRKLRTSTNFPVGILDGVLLLQAVLVILGFYGRQLMASSL